MIPCRRVPARACLQSDVQNIVVKPVILTKATVKLAIYGIGNIKDERLYEVLLSLVFMLPSVAAQPSGVWVELARLSKGASGARRLAKEHARRGLSLRTGRCACCRAS